jgi:hypothetical protein
MLSETKRQVINFKTVASGWLIYLNCMMKHGPANVKFNFVTFCDVFSTRCNTKFYMCM